MTLRDRARSFIRSRKNLLLRCEILLIMESLPADSGVVVLPDALFKVVSNAAVEVDSDAELAVTSEAARDTAFSRSKKAR